MDPADDHSLENRADLGAIDKLFAPYVDIVVRGRRPRGAFCILFADFWRLGSRRSGNVLKLARERRKLAVQAQQVQVAATSSILFFFPRPAKPELPPPPSPRPPAEQAWPTPVLQDTVDATGQLFYTLAFITSQNGKAAWGGVIPLEQQFAMEQIRSLRNQHGDVIVSFGGANGVELAQVGRARIYLWGGAEAGAVTGEGSAQDNTVARGCTSQQEQKKAILLLLFFPFSPTEAAAVKKAPLGRGSQKRGEERREDVDRVQKKKMAHLFARPPAGHH